MDRSIKLVWLTSDYKVGRDSGVRIRITATDAVNMPRKIFAYQSQPMRPSTGERVHEFDHICSAVDLADYPEDEPIPNSSPDWLRKEWVDVLLRSWVELEAFLQAVIEDVRQLKDTLVRIDTLSPGGDLWVDAVPDDSSSSAGA